MSTLSCLKNIITCIIFSFVFNIKCLITVGTQDGRKQCGVGSQHQITRVLPGYPSTTYKKTRQRCVWIVSRVESREDLVLLKPKLLCVCLTRPFVSSIMYMSRTLRVGGSPVSHCPTNDFNQILPNVCCSVVTGGGYDSSTDNHSPFAIKMYVHLACKKMMRSVNPSGFSFFFLESNSPESSIVK